MHLKFSLLLQVLTLRHTCQNAAILQGETRIYIFGERQQTVTILSRLIAHIGIVRCMLNPSHRCKRLTARARADGPACANY